MRIELHYQKPAQANTALAQVMELCGEKGDGKKSDEWHNYVALFLEEGIWGVCL